MSVVEKAMDKLRRSQRGVVTGEPIGTAVPGTSSPMRQTSNVSNTPGPIHANFRRFAFDLGALRAAGYLPESGLERRFAAQYRQIKRPIVESAMKADPGNAKMRLVMLTSALPGDGKTFTSVNLAFSMARERDLSVLLVDADVASPRISEVFAQTKAPGLLDALLDPALDVESLIASTDVAGLAFLPAGRPVENATELISSGRMEQVVAKLLANARRIVLFDSPPLLVSSEAQALLKSAGQIVLVVGAGKTPRQALTEAIGLIDEEKSVGLVLNQAPGKQSAEYYGYGLYGAQSDDADTSS